MKKKKDRLVNYHLKHLANKKLKWKILSDYIQHFCKFHLDWLHELARLYKERGELPVWGVITLPSFYQNPNDKEVAAFAGLLLKENCSYEQIQEIREMIGEHPWDWFVGREFVHLSFGDRQNQKTAGIWNWRISQMFDELWRGCQNVVGTPPKLITEPLHTAIERNKEEYLLGSIAAFYDIVHKWAVQPEFNIRLLWMWYTSPEPFGCGKLDCPEGEKVCPITSGIRNFIQTWVPNYRGQMGTLDEAINLFGFERDCDFLYAYLGYQELCKLNPEGCKKYATTYQVWYDKGNKKKPYQWRSVMPELNVLT